MAAKRSRRGARLERLDHPVFLLEFSTNGDNVISRTLLGNIGLAGGVPLVPNLEGSILGFCHGGKLGELQGLAFCGYVGFVHSDF
eukprot:7452222-Ditylum_brightwellii.AAC.1